LKQFDIQGLDEQTKLSIRLYEESVKLSKEDSAWRKHYYSITQMGGEHNDIPSFLINIHRIDSLSDARAYLSRLSKIEHVFASNCTTKIERSDWRTCLLNLLSVMWQKT
jgi:uncharacterized protein (DUF885 family)